jgi:hypothetical protein
VRCDAAQPDHRATAQEMDMVTHVRRAPFKSQSRPHSSSCDDPQIPHRRKYGKTACLAICKGSSTEMRIAARSALIFRAGACLPRSQVEASRTPNRNKIKSLSDSLSFRSLPATEHSKSVAFLSHLAKNIKYRNYLSIFCALRSPNGASFPPRPPPPVDQCNEL